jgi:hypothetical protein|tara:strand:+ start:6468 stop:7127 length:660 start_codon:yes stop_codon:yes gene_type:complete
MNIVTVKWGDKYSVDDVNKLYYSCVATTHENDIHFYCYTDDSIGLNPHINWLPLIDMDLDGVWNKLSLFKPGMLPEGKWLYLDLDVIIQGRLDEIYMQNQFTMVKCYWKPIEVLRPDWVFEGRTIRDHDINSSVMLFHNDENHHIWEHFWESPDDYMMAYPGIDGFIYCEGFAPNNYWKQGRIYSKYYGIKEESWYNPPDEPYYLETAAICLLNGPLKI